MIGAAVAFRDSACGDVFTAYCAFLGFGMNLGKGFLRNVVSLVFSDAVNYWSSLSMEIKYRMGLVVAIRNYIYIMIIQRLFQSSSPSDFRD
jgi:hypothetical protein